MTSKAHNLTESILNIIKEEDLKPNDKIWSESRFSTELEENKSTVHRAIKLLEQTGLVSCKRSGTIMLREIKSEDFDITRNIKNIRKVYLLFTDDLELESVHWGVPAFRALENTLNENGRKLICKQLSKRIIPDEFVTTLDSVIAQKPEAIIFSVNVTVVNCLKKLIDKCMDSKIPIYVHEHASGQGLSSYFHSVSLDSFRDGQNVGRLIQTKNAELVFFLYEKHSKEAGWAKQRLDGVKSILENKIKMQEYESVSVLIKEVKKNLGKNMVIIALNNLVAAELIDNARQSNLTYPHNYSLISFDDYSKYYSYNITSMQPPLEKIGELLGKLVCENSYVKNGGSTMINFKICSKYIERGTFSEY